MKCYVWCEFKGWEKKAIIPHSNTIVNIKKIIHPLFWESVLSQDEKGVILISF